MKYENQKSLTSLIDSIVLSESEELSKKIKINEETNTGLKNKIIDLNKEIKDLKNKIEYMFFDIEIIKKYEEITGRYFVANPVCDDVSGQGDIEMVGLDIDEVSREYKYPEKELGGQTESVSDNLPF